MFLFRISYIFKCNIYAEFRKQDRKWLLCVYIDS